MAAMLAMIVDECVTAGGVLMIVGCGANSDAGVD